MSWNVSLCNTLLYVSADCSLILTSVACLYGMQEGSPRAQRILVAAEAAASALQIMTVPGMPQRGEGPVPRMSWQLLLLLLAAAAAAMHVGGSV